MSGERGPLRPDEQRVLPLGVNRLVKRAQSELDG